MTDSSADAGDEAAERVGPVTVRDRFLAAGIDLESFEAHLAAGRVLVAMQRVSDPDTPAPKPVDVGIGLTPDVWPPASEDASA